MHQESMDKNERLLEACESVNGTKPIGNVK